MLYALYGAVGITAVLLLLALGCAIGWKLRKAWEAHTRRAVADEASEEERRAMKAEQQAFESMLNYNMDTAYGLNMSLEEMARGDDE